MFADQQALRDLEAITHGAIGERAAALEAVAGPDAVVVHDNPLLIEMGTYERVDLVVVVDVPVDTQVERLVEQRGMTEADARARISAQATREQRAAVADLVIDNSGPEVELDARVRDLWRRLREQTA